MIRHIPDAIAGWFGYVPERVAQHRINDARNKAAAKADRAGYARGHRLGMIEGAAQFGRSVQDEVTRRAGEIEAERNGYKAQWEQAERRLKAANRRLQADGKMPVTSFVY